LVALDDGGSEKWRATATGSLGAPAARGGIVAVPFSYQNLVLLDGKGGKELARIRATDAQIGYVRAAPEGFFYGAPDQGVVLLDEKSLSGSQKESSRAQANLGSDQIRPAYYWDAYQGSHVDYSAFDRNRLLWRAESRQASVAFIDSVVYLHNYRYLFSFDAWSGKLNWVFANPRIDLVSSEDARTAVVVASADGEVSALDAKTGAHEVLVKTGLRITGGTIDAEGLKVSAQVSDADLAKRLEQIIWDHDARFTAVKVFAARALGDLSGKDATLGLLRIVQKDGGIQPTVQKSAGERMIARKDCDAAGALLDALKGSHYDYLAVEQHRGAEVIARAIAGLDASTCKIDYAGATREVAAHLEDPETPAAALPDLVKALLQLGATAKNEAASALTAFLMTYRADPAFLVDPGPLVQAADALLVVGGQEGRRAVAFVAGEAQTLAPLKAEANKLLHPRAAGKGSAKP
jgi:outer membrane protein assembly factor BamB